MSSENLERCSDELATLLVNIQNTITYQLPRKEGDERLRSTRALESNINEAEGLLRDIQQDLRKAPQSYQISMSASVGQFKRDIASLRKQVNGGSSMREELFSKQEHSDPFETGSDSGRAKLLRNTDTMKKASASLGRAQNVSAHTDQLAVDIMEDLDDQKSSLLRTRDKLTSVDGEMNRTTTLLRSIVCKTLQNRLLLVIVIICEIIILAGVIYWKFFS